MGAKPRPMPDWRLSEQIPADRITDPVDFKEQPQNYISQQILFQFFQHRRDETVSQWSEMSFRAKLRNLKLLIFHLQRFLADARNDKKTNYNTVSTGGGTFSLTHHNPAPILLVYLSTFSQNTLQKHEFTITEYYCKD